MATTNDGARLSVTRLILVPSLITLAVTILRVYAELHHWGSPWVSNGVGGGPSIIGIVWLAPIFGIYFASKLAAMGAGPASTGKTVVLTGAMVPYAFGSSDGLFNLGSALSFAQALPPGVYVAMNGRCFDWDKVRKNRETGAFEAL